jgi:hypothetical protein
LLGWLVLDAACLGRVACAKLFESKVLGNFHIFGWKVQEFKSSRA